jgi:oxygen-independent coproporphyrinogen-3 oxidase
VGTPSLFSAQGIARLISDLRARFELGAQTAKSLWKPTRALLKRSAFTHSGMQELTVLSVGVQSFNDKHLHALGRVHNAAQAMSAVQEAA